MTRLRAWFQNMVRETLQEELQTYRRDSDSVVVAALDEVHAAIDDAGRHSQRLLASRDDDFTKLLVRVAESMDAVVSQLDAESRDLRVYLAKTEMLMRELVLAGMRNDGAVPPTPSTIVGGSIESRALTRADMGAGSENEIDLRDALIPGAPVEVRSHFQGRWMGGFRVLDVVSTDDGPLYRVERRYDHSALPVLFGAAEIRPMCEPTTRDDVPINP